MFNATTVNTIFATVVDDIEFILTNALPVVLVVLAALIGLGILIRFIQAEIEVGRLAWRNQSRRAAARKILKDTYNYWQ